MALEMSLMEEFVGEAREHLATVEADFLAIEKSGGSPDAQVVNRVFRAVHTIKGGAGFLGLQKIGELAHRMETLLAIVRDGAMPLKNDAIEILLDGVDRLSGMFDRVASSNETEIGDLLDRLNLQMDKDSDPKERSKLQETVNVPVPGGREEFRFEAYNLHSIPAEHRLHMYVLSYDLNRFQESKGRSPLQLVDHLSTMGTIVDGFLSCEGMADLRQELPSQPLVYRVLYGTALEADIISMAVELETSQIEIVDGIQTGGAKKMSPPDPIPPRPSVESIEPVSSFEPVQEFAASTPSAKVEPREEGVAPQSMDSVRIRLDILDHLMQLAGELVLVRNQQLMHVNRADPISRTIAQKLNIVTSDLQETIMRTRMQPIGTVFSRFSRIVRDLGKKLGKNIEIDMFGNDVELDKTILEALTDPLVHIIRNSCDHGIETPAVRRAQGKSDAGRIILNAYHQGGQMIVEIADDGKGVDAEAVKTKAIEKNLKTAEEIARMNPKEIQALIFLPGFSTAEALSDVSGRGVGMDVVKTSIERLGGVIDLNSEKGSGTRIILRLPLTLAIIPSLVVRSGKQRFAIPQISLEELVCLYGEDIATKIECAGSREVYRLRDILLPIVRLSRVLEESEPFDDQTKARITEQERALREELHGKVLLDRAEGRLSDATLSFAVLKVGGSRFGLVIDDVIGSEEIVVKPMHRAVKNLSIYAGATVLGDGEVALILDVQAIARHANVDLEDNAQTARRTANPTDSVDKRNLFLFKSGPEEQFAVDMSVMRRVEQIRMDQVESSAGHDYIAIDGVSTQILRLDDHMPVSPVLKEKEMFLLLPKSCRSPYGILVSRIIDIGEFASAVSHDTIRDPCVEGSTIIRDRMTLILSPDALHRRARPEPSPEVAA